LSIAAVTIIAVVGALAMVVDAGIFFVIQRQFQAAADAAALAGAWHKPVCTSDPLVGCEPDGDASAVAKAVAEANAKPMEILCGSPINPPSVTVGGPPQNLPARVNTIVVTVSCRAGYSFGRILNLQTVDISASAAAALGKRTNTREIDTPPAPGDGCTPPPPPAIPPATGTPPCLIARLIE
jgi:uncharacterized membrane protein